MAANEFFIEGKLLKKYDTQQVTATFSKREMVVEVPGTYVQYVKFELKQARCAELDNFQEGEAIKVHFNIEGREWQGKYFTNLAAWRLEKVGAATPAAPTNNSSFPTANDEPKFDAVGGGDDDLPF